LFSPQRWIEQNEKKIEFIIKKDKCCSHFKNNEKLETNVSEEIGLPILECSVNLSRNKLEKCLCSVLSDNNKNLSALQKELLRWHYRLGHVNFQTLQWIGRQRILEEYGTKWGSTTINPLICEDCQYGKQARTPRKSSTSKSKNEEVLYKEKLNPGDLIFSDQFESSMGGRYYNDQGKIKKHHEYKGGTVFYDAANKYIYVSNQVGFTAYETCNPK